MGGADEALPASQHPDASDEPIFELAVDCGRQFEKVLESEATTEPAQSGRLIKEYHRLFWAWAQYVGVFAAGKASLDWRLRRNSNYRDLFLLALDMLRVNLLQLLPLDARSVDSGDSDLSDDSDPRGVAFEGIEESVAQLNSLGISIRRHSTSRLESKVKAFAAKRVDQQNDFEILALVAVQRLYPEAATSLHQRLSKNMVDTYMRLLYWKSHKEKLEGNRGGPRHHDSILPETQPIETRHAPVPSDDNLPKESCQRPAPAAPSMTEATSLPSSHPPPIRKGKEGHIKETKHGAAATVLKTMVKFPRAPKEGGSTCWYCHKVHSAEEYQDETWWKNHTNNDILPYICLFDFCLGPKVFSTSGSWAQHMSSEHGDDWALMIPDSPVWKCDFASQDHGATPYFATLSHLRGHYKTAHLDDDGLKRLDQSVAANRPPVVCPFCYRTLHYGKHGRDAQLAVKDKDESSDANLPVAPTAKKVNWAADVKQAPTETQDEFDSIKHLNINSDLSSHIAEHLQRLGLLTVRLKDVFSARDDGITGDMSEASIPTDEQSTAGSRSTVKDLDPDYPSDDDDFDNSLVAIIQQHRIPSYEEDTDGYLPFAVLRRVMTPERIRAALRKNCGFTEDKRITQLCAEIVPDGLTSNATRWCADAPSPPSGSSRSPPGYLIVFALLLEIDRGALIEYFIQQGCSDAKLPLQTKRCQHELHLVEATKPRDLESRQWLRYTDIKWLRARQWFFLTPFFACEEDGTPKHYCLPVEAQLPWRPIPMTDKDRWLTSHANDGQYSGWGRPGGLGTFKPAGGFGMVEPVIIDPDSHGFHAQLRRLSLPNNRFAVIPIRKADADRYKKEIQILKRCSSRSHEHLVTFLATFEHKDQYCFIFPYAECNLDQHWKSLKSPRKTPEFALWASAQVLGLAEAIHILHNPPRSSLGEQDAQRFGRHGGLKPEDILYFPPPDDGGGGRESSAPNALRALWRHGLVSPEDKALGKLVITDFRLADVQSYSKWAPPEYDMKGDINSRLWDIWTLGCIFLEMVCWMLGDGKKSGQDRREEFAQDRLHYDLFRVGTDQFYEIMPQDHEGRYGFRVNDMVVQWIEKMHKNPCCTQYLHELLDLVYDHMLVVPSPPQLDRIRPRALLERVQGMHSKAQGVDGIAYLTEHQPWPNQVVQRRLVVRAELDEELQVRTELSSMSFP
ncbi:hypothetical protein RB598_003767 [Gaeumannomyces tritici]